MNNVKNEFEIVYAVCCRPWPVIRFGMIRPCGICKETPVVQSDYTDKDYEAYKASK